MATWITICNLSRYDVEGAFETLGIIDWKQSTNIEAGDIVYIYVSNPIGGIKFKCRANKVNLPNCQIDDSAWVMDGSPFDNYGRYMELELLHKFDTVVPYLADLQSRGIEAIMGPLTVNDKALDFLIECEKKDSGVQKLKREDLVDDLVVIKINRSYSPDMSDVELYETTRGIWKRKIESVSKARFCLSVANSRVVEVYEIEQWYSAGTIPMKTRTFSSAECKGRIEFIGHIAEEEARSRYIDKSIADLYKMGEADPVKVFLKENLNNNVSDINVPLKPNAIIELADRKIVVCPNCQNNFTAAKRCPECGQLILYI